MSRQHNRFLSAFLIVAVLVVLFASTAIAQTAPAGAAHPPGFMDILSKMLPMFAIVFLIFYVMVIRPQQQRITDQQKLIESLKRGENVVTTGGLIGRIASIEKEIVLIEVAAGVKVKVETAHIARRHDKALEDKNAA